MDIPEECAISLSLDISRFKLFSDKENEKKDMSCFKFISWSWTDLLNFSFPLFSTDSTRCCFSIQHGFFSLPKTAIRQDNSRRT